MLPVEKIENKTSYIKYGTPAIKWQLVTFTNGTKGAYLDNKLMPLNLAADLIEVTDKVYTMTSILHKHPEFLQLN